MLDIMISLIYNDIIIMIIRKEGKELDYG